MPMMMIGSDPRRLLSPSDLCTSSYSTTTSAINTASSKLLDSRLFHDYNPRLWLSQAPVTCDPAQAIASIFATTPDPWATSPTLSSFQPDALPPSPPYWTPPALPTMPEGHSVPSTPSASTPIRRTRLGCLTCRGRRVKCDETKPVCGACRRLQRECRWQEAKSAPTRHPRRANATACQACRARKLKCEGDPRRGPCYRCETDGTECLWNGSERSDRGGAMRRYGSGVGAPISPTLSSALSYDVNPFSPDTEVLIDKYFDTVHHFGFLAFIHKLRFKRLLASGKAPKELTQIMVANTLRLACDPTPENLQRADALADSVVASLVPNVLQGFGVVQLFTMLLASFYEQQRNNFASSWMLTALCTRMMQMMSLMTFDQTFGGNIETPLSPLLSAEALRRAAWAVFYQDSMIDGGRLGYSLVDVTTFRIQLPCTEQSFLGIDGRIPEMGGERSGAAGTIGISGYIVRAAMLRQRALCVAARISQQEGHIRDFQNDLAVLEHDINDFAHLLPQQYNFTADNVFLHRERMPAFIILHLLRHNLYIILGRAKLLLYNLDPMFDDLVAPARHQRITRALYISGIIEEGIKYTPSFDPHAGIQAYVALEILLFEPRRLNTIDPNVDPKAEHIVKAIPPLLAVIRELGRRSVSMKSLHVEAVHRLLRCDFLRLLVSYDLETFSNEYQPAGQDEAEYDFRDLRFAKLERARRERHKGPISNEGLLEYRPDTSHSPVAEASPRGAGANDVRQPMHHPPSFDISPIGSSAVDSASAPSVGSVNSAVPPPMPAPVPAMQPWLALFDPVAAEQATAAAQAASAPPVDLSWLLNEAGDAVLQTGDPQEFWKQISQQ